MSFFTLAYLVRLEMWGLAIASFQGGLVLLSWRSWDRSMKHVTASARHRVVCMHLALLLALPALTMIILHRTIAGMGIPAMSGSPIAALPLLMANYRDALRLGLPVAALWLAGTCLMLLRLLLDARRLVRLPCQPAPTALTHMAQRLASVHLGIAVPRVRTADIPTPQIVGWRQPALLVPYDLDKHLSAAEQQAVLLHELAHVHRGDFGWNLLQRLALAVLWFHPAAWALYRHVACEREACCDALAVSYGASPACLAQALLRLAENQARSGLGMAIVYRGELTTRVHRLLGLHSSAPPPTRLRMAAVVVSGLCLLALGVGWLGRADPSMVDVYNASAFGPVIAVDAHDDAGSFVLQIRRGHVIGAMISKQVVPRGRIVQHGDQVTLMDAMREPLVAFTVTPQGRIEWTARHGRS
jgi:beta-lactamase regulating signal transducer with metallopeptidase domain